MAACSKWYSMQRQHAEPACSGGTLQHVACPMQHPATALTELLPLTLHTPAVAQVKAWCYYESRLLGAHHGLISTYALETLVLYVFNKHHALRPITSPLQVRGSLNGWNGGGWGASLLGRVQRSAAAQLAGACA
jgi:hypothetical protein